MLRTKRVSPKLRVVTDLTVQDSFDKEDRSKHRYETLPKMIWKRNSQKVFILITTVVSLFIACSMTFEFSKRSMPNILNENYSSLSDVAVVVEEPNSPISDTTRQTLNSISNPQEDKNKEEEQSLKQSSTKSQDDAEIENNIVSTQVSSKFIESDSSNSKEEKVIGEEVVVEEVKDEGYEQKSKQLSAEDKASAKELVEDEKTEDDAKSEDEATDKVEEVEKVVKDVVEVVQENNEKAEEKVAKETEEVMKDVVEVDEEKEQEEQKSEQSPSSTESTSTTNVSLQKQKSSEENKPNPSSDATTNVASDATSDDASLPCALLFFGVIKDDFKDLVLPSIRTNIIEHNPQCDVFLHTYNLTHVPYNPRTREFKPTKTDVTQAYELTSHVIIDTMENFDAQRGSILNHTRQHRHPGYHESETHDNIIKQWHSIEGAWDLMQEHEAEMLQQSDVSNDKHYYKRVGLFRSDTFFTDPIPIHDTNEVAAIANFAHWSGYNDRMFYGTYDNASVWAHRFNFTETYDSYKSGAGYHSETYLLRMLKHNGIKPAMKDVCIWRVRAGGKLKVDDCSPNGKGGEDDVIKNLEESGYEVVKKSKEFWETQRKESSDPSSTSST